MTNSEANFSMLQSRGSMWNAILIDVRHLSQLKCCWYFYPATSISNALRLINQDVSFHQADWFLIQSIGKVISLGISTLCLAAAAVVVNSSRPTNNVFTFIHLFRYSFSRTFIKSILIFNRLQLFSLDWLCEWRMSVNIFKCMQIDRMCVCVLNEIKATPNTRAHVCLICSAQTHSHSCNTMCTALIIVALFPGNLLICHRDVFALLCRRRG